LPARPDDDVHRTSQRTLGTLLHVCSGPESKTGTYDVILMRFGTIDNKRHPTARIIELA